MQAFGDPKFDQRLARHAEMLSLRIKSLEITRTTPARS
jgi:hypothetical protein